MRRKEEDRYPKIAKLHARVSQSVSQSDSFKAVDVVAKNCHATPTDGASTTTMVFRSSSKVGRQEGRKKGREGGREEERVEGERQLNNRRKLRECQFSARQKRPSEGASEGADAFGGGRRRRLQCHNYERTRRSRRHRRRCRRVGLICK